MSFDVNVDVSAIEKFIKTLQYVNIQINGDLTANELVIIGERTLEIARQTIPFDTGAARESLQMIVDANTKTVTIGSDGGIRPNGERHIYLRYLELGTSKITARPFLLPAVTQALNEFKQRYPLKIMELARVSI
jgi:HK97 gp10 family phage protein